MLICGTRWKTVTLGQLLYGCSHCQKQTMHTAQIRKGKVTLFFIPTFPVGSRYLIACNLCGLWLKAVGNLLGRLKEWEKTGRFSVSESGATQGA